MGADYRRAYMHKATSQELVWTCMHAPAVMFAITSSCDSGQPALTDRFPALSSPALSSQFQHLNQSLLQQIHDLVVGSGATVTTESGAQLNPFDPVSLADPHTMSMHVRVRELERILLPSEFEQVESMQDYYTRAAKRVLLSPSIRDAAARARSPFCTLSAPVTLSV